MGKTPHLRAWPGELFASVVRVVFPYSPASVPEPSAKEFLRRFLDFLFPRTCIICGRIIPSIAGNICPFCFDELPRHYPNEPHCRICGEFGRAAVDYVCPACTESPPPFSAAFSAVNYSKSVRKIVHALKYERGIWLRRDLGIIMRDAYEEFYGFLPKPDCIIPIPLFETREHSRGYNQAALICRELARSLDVPIEQLALERVRRTVSQTHLSAAQRHENIHGSMEVVRPERVVGKRILLIDDVMTTGATFREAALRLKDAGAAEIICLAFARRDFG